MRLLSCFEKKKLLFENRSSPSGFLFVLRANVNISSLVASLEVFLLVLVETMTPLHRIYLYNLALSHICPLLTTGILFTDSQIGQLFCGTCQFCF